MAAFARLVCNGIDVSAERALPLAVVYEPVKLGRLGGRLLFGFGLFLCFGFGLRLLRHLLCRLFFGLLVLFLLINLFLVLLILIEEIDLFLVVLRRSRLRAPYLNGRVHKLVDLCLDLLVRHLDLVGHFGIDLRFRLSGLLGLSLRLLRLFRLLCRLCELLPGLRHKALLTLRIGSRHERIEERFLLSLTRELLRLRLPLLSRGGCGGFLLRLVCRRVLRDPACGDGLSSALSAAAHTGSYRIGVDRAAVGAFPLERIGVTVSDLLLRRTEKHIPQGRLVNALLIRLLLHLRFINNDRLIRSLEGVFAKLVLYPVLDKF